jgi:hypothetical protein
MENKSVNEKEKTKVITTYEAGLRLYALEELKNIAEKLVSPITPESIINAITVRQVELANSVSFEELKEVRKKYNI